MAKRSSKTETPAEVGMPEVQEVQETPGVAEIGETPVTHDAPTRVARVTKKDAVIALLRRVQGASLAEICDATGWQRHTARAALSGLRKAGYVLHSERDSEGDGDGQMLYQVTALPPAAE